MHSFSIYIFESEIKLPKYANKSDQNPERILIDIYIYISILSKRRPNILQSYTIVYYLYNNIPTIF